MDKVQMHALIDLILKPYKGEIDERNLGGQPPVLIFDANIMLLIVNHIQLMEVEVIHIPAGCTCFCQLIIMGFNQPLKNAMHGRWEAWMVSDGIINPNEKQRSYHKSRWSSG